MIETVFAMDEEEMTPGMPEEGGDGGMGGGTEPASEPAEPMGEPEGRFDGEGDDSDSNMEAEARLGDEEEEDGSDNEE